MRPIKFMMVNNITSMFGLDFSVNVIICWKCECLIFGAALSGVFPQIMLGQYPVPGPSGKDYVARNFEAIITEQNGSAMLCGNSKIVSLGITDYHCVQGRWLYV